MYKSLLSILLLLLLGPDLMAQVNARMSRYPDVSQDKICFVYAGDIWVVDKTGGEAQRLSSPKGEEMLPRFSPDGQEIAFSGNYDGNTDIYTLAVKGGVPKRLSFHGGTDRMLDWHPNGKQILFASTRKSGKQRFNQFYLIDKTGGLAEKLPLEQAEFGSFSPDGKQIAFTDRTRVFRNWKRYRGGSAPDVHIYDFNSKKSQNISNNAANDELPMWNENKIFYLSDQGPEKRYNIWVYDIASKENRQITQFADYDAHFPGMGPEEMVFEAGGKLYLLNLDKEEYKEVKIQVRTDFISLAPKMEKAQGYIQHGNISPDGKRVILEARGELFSVPAEQGYIKNLSNSSGSAERYPAWSPDGKYVAYWSDKSGEYQLNLLNLENNQAEALSNFTQGFYYSLYFSPDSKKLAFIDQAQKIKIFDLNTKKTIEVDQGLYMMHGGLESFQADWSPDSRWLAYSRAKENRNQAIFLYDFQNRQLHQISSEFYSHNNPSFDPEGKYLYLKTNRHFSPQYSAYDNSFIYPNSTQIALLTLRKDIRSPLSAQNDEVSVKASGEEKKEETKKDDKPAFEIDLEGLESRMVLLPMSPGNYGKIKALKGKLIYHQAPNTGSTMNKAPLKYFDLQARESKTILDNVQDFEVSANGQKILALSSQGMAVVNVGPKQKMDKKLPLRDMEVKVDPKAEWNQIFNDVWRMQRDYFYDKDMHGLDWDAVKKQYAALMESAVTRGDVNFVIGELIAELNASHTYRGGGDVESPDYRNVGYLGIDWEINQGKYRVKKVLAGADWETEERSPLNDPGVNVKEGDYILAVNGMELDTQEEPYAAFQGLGNKTVELLVNSEPTKTGARKVIIQTMSSEYRLRNLAWIEANRKRVDEASNGQAGYVYVPSTGIDGQNELVRQFYGQFHKKALVIDERFNNGGQIPDRFIELLNRKPLAGWAVRDGKDWQWPPVASFGTKVMLINGWSGSGGDAFPDYFRKAGLGPLIGARTWGGLIGISGAPSLIDGGYVTVPTFRMYDPDGTWFKEGHGVDPDIEVKENPGELAQGKDAQLEKAIQHILDKLGSQGAEPNRDPAEKR